MEGAIGEGGGSKPEYINNTAEENLFIRNVIHHAMNNHLHFFRQKKEHGQTNVNYMPPLGPVIYLGGGPDNLSESHLLPVAVLFGPRNTTFLADFPQIQGGGVRLFWERG